ncbi:IS607 family transposase [Chromatium weissei]|nr:IS607 family transposase [Chromatium weissei]
MPTYLPSRKAAQILGLHPNTLRKYADEGRIPSIKTASGQRRYDVGGYLSSATPPTVVCYCRVSSYGQRDDFARQIASVAERFPGAEVVKDIGSALNYQRKGLKSLLGRCLRGEKLTIVVAHRDRLARFGFELIDWLVRECGGSIVVLNDAIREPERELTEDLFTVIHAISCRFYGLRNNKSKKNQIATKQVAMEGAEFVVRNLSVRLQRNGMVTESADCDTQLHGD